MTPRDALSACPAEPCLPVARRVLPADLWTLLPQEPSLRLLALWADTQLVHALLLDETDGSAVPVSTPVEAGAYPALSPGWQAAALFERMVRDLWGHAAFNARDPRPWLDHGTWPHTMPLAPRPGPPVVSPEPPEFVTDPSDGLMQLPLGPVRDAIGEPTHLRLSVRDDRVLRAEARLGYAHKGTLLLLRGKSPRAAAHFVARLSADITVAHALAFAHAAEAASASPAPPRAVALRALMAEVERIAGHLDALSLLASALEAQALAGLCGLHREMLRRSAEVAFGHRLMMDWLIPGGVAADIAPGGAEAVRRSLQRLGEALPELGARIDALEPRLVGIATVPLPLATNHALGGIAGRAAGRRFDARTRYAPYAARELTVATQTAGDAVARNRQRLAEITESLRLAVALLDDMPEGAVNLPLNLVSGEGIGCAESTRGDVWHWLRLDHGQIAAAFMRDPGWVLWPVAETVLVGSRVEEADIARLSLGLPSSGMDL